MSSKACNVLHKKLKEGYFGGGVVYSYARTSREEKKILFIKGFNEFGIGILSEIENLTNSIYLIK